MVREQARREMLAARKLTRRHFTIWNKYRLEYHRLIRDAHSAGATPTELAKLLDLSTSRIQQIVKGENVRND